MRRPGGGVFAFGSRLGSRNARVGSRVSNIGLADSALAVPRAAFGDYEAFPTLIEKAAILVERLARNHPLPDGNKRCAFLALERFLAVNDQPIPDPNPDVDVSASLLP
jgi:prophage maintenance system killer protein